MPRDADQGPAPAFDGVIRQVRLRTVVAALGGSVAPAFDDSVTHLVAELDAARLSKRTLKYLQAVSAGLWIVGPDCARCARVGTPPPPRR